MTEQINNLLHTINLADYENVTELVVSLEDLKVLRMEILDLTEKVKQGNIDIAVVNTRLITALRKQEKTIERLDTYI